MMDGRIGLASFAPRARVGARSMPRGRDLTMVPGTEACVERCGSLDRDRVEFVGRARESTGSGERVGYAATPAADRLPESSCASRVTIVIDLIVQAGANSVPAGSKSRARRTTRPRAARGDVNAARDSTRG